METIKFCPSHKVDENFVFCVIKCKLSWNFYQALAGLILIAILLSQPSKCWDCWHILPYLEKLYL